MTPVERAARAMFPYLWDKSRQLGKEERLLMQAEALGYARAAIASLREPSGDMLHAGGRACQEYCDFTMEAALSAWRCMIDTALSEGEPEPRSETTGHTAGG